MSRLYYVSGEGTSQPYATLAEARTDAEAQIAEYGRDAREEGEWSLCVEDVCIFECDRETDEPEEDGRMIMRAAHILVGTDEETGEEYYDFKLQERQP